MLPLKCPPKFRDLAPPLHNMCIINEDVLEEHIVDGREEQYKLGAAEIFYSQNDEDEDVVQKQNRITNMFV